MNRRKLLFVTLGITLTGLLILLLASTTSLGLRARLFVEKRSFRIHEPIVLKVELTNRSLVARKYVTATLVHDKFLRVLGPDGAAFHLQGGLYTFCECGRTIAPLEKQIAGEGDVAHYWGLNKPGRYSVKFLGCEAAKWNEGAALPASQTIEFEILPGEPVARTWDPDGKTLPGWGTLLEKVKEEQIAVAAIACTAMPLDKDSWVVTGDGRTTPLYDGTFQRFRVSDSLVGVKPTDQMLRIHYPGIGMMIDNPIWDGEQVIWFLGNPSKQNNDAWVGIKAIPDTPENRRRTTMLFPSAQDVNESR